MYGMGVAEDKAKGMGCIRFAAEDGSMFAFNVLARLYRSRDGGEQNNRKAFVCYKRAAEFGNSYAHFQLGEMYRYGEGTAVNVKRAIHHFDICAKHEE